MSNFNDYMTNDVDSIVRYRLGESTGATATDTGSAGVDASVRGTYTWGQTGLVTADPDTAILLGSDGVIAPNSITPFSNAGTVGYTRRIAFDPTSTYDGATINTVLEDYHDGTNGILDEYETGNYKVTHGSETASFAITFTAGSNNRLIRTYDATTKTLSLYNNNSLIDSHTFTNALIMPLSLPFVEGSQILKEDTPVDDNNFGNGIEVSEDRLFMVVGIQNYGTGGGVRSYSRVTENDNWVEFGSPLVASDIGVGDEYGYGMTMSGNALKMTVGAPGHNSGAGAAYTYVRASRTDPWPAAHRDKINGTSGDRLGQSVSLTRQGSVLAVGLLTDSPGTNAGSVNVYDDNVTGWSTRITGLQSAGIAATDYFGNDVAFGEDDTYLAVCALYWGLAGFNGYGRVYLFKKNGSTYDQIGYISSPSGTTQTRFAATAVFSNDCSRIFVGEYFKTINSISGAGRVNVYTGDPEGGFTLDSDFNPSVLEINMFSGLGLSCDNTGSYAAIGAANEDNGGIDRGSVYFFEEESYVIGGSRTVDEYSYEDGATTSEDVANDYTVFTGGSLEKVTAIINSIVTNVINPLIR